jgi:hypothetical protein
MEHRWGERKAIDVPVRFVALPATIGAGRITNVSMTGAFMETQSPVRLLCMLYVEMIHLPKLEGRKRRLSASVVRRTPLGVGIEWCEPVSKSALYARLKSESQDASPAPELTDGIYCYQFDFLD